MFGFDLVLVSKKQNSESTCKLSCSRILYSDPFWTQTGLMIQDIVRQKLMAFQFPSAMCLHFRTSIGKGEVFNSNNNYEYFLSIFRMGMRWPHHLLQQTRWTKSTICCVNAQNLSECSNRCCSAWRERWKVVLYEFSW